MANSDADVVADFVIVISVYALSAVFWLILVLRMLFLLLLMLILLMTPPMMLTLLKSL